MAKTTNSLSLYDFISMPLQCYSAAGIKLFQWSEDDYMTSKEKCIMAFLTFNLLVNFVAKTLFGIFGEFIDTVQITQWILYLIFAVNGYCKMLSVVFGRKMLHNVLKDIQRIFPQSTKERRDFNLMDCYAYIMRHTKIMGIQHLCIAIMFILFPIVQSTIEYLGSSEENPVFVARTPYILLYPFDTSGGIGYICAYCSQFLGGLTISSYFVGSDMMLMCTVYLVTMQYQYLCQRIENFKSSGYDQDMKELCAVLKRHSILNDLAKTINNVFSLSILLNYMISIILIVMISIQIITDSETLDLVKFVGFFTASTTQVYYVCLFGTNLMQHSSRVSECFIGQEWYLTDVRYQRMLVLAIARSQKPSHLTAFKFFVISMESFGNLMTTAYQFFTLLKAQMEEHQI